MILGQGTKGLLRPSTVLGVVAQLGQAHIGAVFVRTVETLEEREGLSGLMRRKKILLAYRSAVVFGLVGITFCLLSCTTQLKNCSY